MILGQLPDIDINMIRRREIDGKLYLALYLGISKDLKGRIKWHTCQYHTPSTVNSGFLSTFRQTLTSLLNIDITNSKNILNWFVEENSYLEWECTETYQGAINQEKQELVLVYTIIL